MAGYVSFRTCYAFHALNRRLHYKREGLADYAYLAEEPVVPFDGTLWFLHHKQPLRTGPITSQKDDVVLVWSTSKSTTALTWGLKNWAYWVPGVWPFLGESVLQLFTDDWSDLRIPMGTPFSFRHSPKAVLHTSTADWPYYLRFGDSAPLQWTVTEVEHPDCRGAMEAFDTTVGVTPEGTGGGGETT